MVELSDPFRGRGADTVAVHFQEPLWATGRYHDPTELACICTQLSVVLERLRQVRSPLSCIQRGCFGRSHL